MNPLEQFEQEKKERIESYTRDPEFKGLSQAWISQAMRKYWVYNFTWMGRPIIQNPVDMIALQEIVWAIKPDLIIETGVAHGGSVIYSASLLELVGHGEVIGIDIDIREHNRPLIENHPMGKRLTLIEGSSIDPVVIAQVHALAAGKERVLVCLDSNHTHEHVMAELAAYASLVTPGSYCIVFDTIVEDMPPGSFPNRPWEVGDNPKTAVIEFLSAHPEFETDAHYADKLMTSLVGCGYLRRKD
jgi:cephalosporin hydroxylase